MPDTFELDVQRGSRILRPGVALSDPRLEQYLVKGGGAIAIVLQPGDKLEIVDTEGRQPGEIAVFDAQGHCRPEGLGSGPGQPLEGLAKILSGGDPAAASLIATLRRRQIEPRGVQGLRLFDEDGPAGAARSFLVEAPLTCVVAAPGEAMAVDAQNPPTDLRVKLARARPLATENLCLPDPLADPRLDFQVDRASAQAYEVKAGEYIQVIDLFGRQCSDFLTFAAGRLQDGVECGLDPTTTRTLMGASYPAPGLYSKFFDQEMQPLVEVVRDTCGRHDTFGLACTAKYYEDLGYPGHVSCSENFNNALEPYGIARRKGWPAINFFYNTGIDEANAIYLDESWSRPGDYVLMRATTDLVCASSGCPSDIDACNGWNPTDIHVRVYPEKNLFSKAIATRMTPDSEAKLTQETAFHPRTSQLTRDFGEYRGYWLPNKFTNLGALDEYWACRERVALLDLSALRKFEVLGPDAEALMQYTLTRNVRRLAVGQVSYSAICYDTGGMIDDGTVFRLGPDNFRWICGDDYCGVWLREVAEKQGMHVWVKSSTDQQHNVSVQGPKSRELLKEVVWTPPTQPSIEELGWFRFTIGRIGDMNGPAIVVSRTGYTGELGYEVWCAPKDAVAVWDALWAAGQPHGVAPLGLEGLDMLRIEAGLIFGGYEFCDQTDPFEAGIGFAVALKTKEEDFIGRAALEDRKAHPQRKLVGLEVEGNEIPGNGDCVHVGRAQVGSITSGTRSPILKKTIALCRMDVRHAELGTEVEVGKLDGHMKRLPAKVVPFPFYDPDKSRVRA